MSTNEKMLNYEHTGETLLNVVEFKKAAQELKPCPFCGGAAQLIASMNPIIGIQNGFRFTATCMEPSCCGRTSKEWPTMKVAVFEWNRRMWEEPEFTKEQIDKNGTKRIIEG